jgi:hypothetical protein
MSKLTEKRLRKIEHLKQYKAQNGKAKARQKAIHFMKMSSEDIQAAFEGSIY